jgi:hypothetical protein
MLLGLVLICRFILPNCSWSNGSDFPFTIGFGEPKGRLSWSHSLSRRRPRSQRPNQPRACDCWEEWWGEPESQAFQMFHT